MGVVNGELGRARRAFARPTLALLNKKDAPIIVALFASIFTPQRKTIVADQFLLEVAGHLDDLRTFTSDEMSESGARKLVASWVRDKWLVRAVSDSGDEVFSLTSHAQQAMDFVSRAGGERALISESRIRTLLNTLERFALDAQPDRGKRISIIDQQIKALRAEKKRLEAGGEIEPTSDSRMEEQFDNVRYLVRELPADFTRVAESIKDLQRSILSQLRQDERPTGQVLEDYLRASEDLLSHTPEGKAFTGALELLKSEQLLTQLEASIDAILSHPFARSLSRSERESFRATKFTILEALGVVLSEQQRASRTLTTQVRNHNPLRDRELDEALRGAIVALNDWFPLTARGESVDALTRFERANFGRLRTGLHDLHDDLPPESIAQNVDIEQVGLDLEDIIAMGGPRHRELQAHVEELMRSSATEVTIGDAFSSGPKNLKRPVEILGYQEIAAEGYGESGDSHGDDLLKQSPGTGENVSPTSPLERIIAIRADGSQREFIIPRQTLNQPAKASHND